jgi:hypothetical protein
LKITFFILKETQFIMVKVINDYLYSIKTKQNYLNLNSKMQIFIGFILKNPIINSFRYSSTIREITHFL